MPFSGLDFEMARVGEKLARQLLRVKPGEDVLVIGDSRSDLELVRATSVSVRSAGGEPLVFIMEARPNANTEPPDPLAAAMERADVICDFAKMYMIHTQAYRNALSKGVRALCLTGMDADMSLRCLAQVDYDALLNLGEKLADATQNGKSMRITSQAGTDIEFRNDGRPVFHMTGVLDANVSKYNIPLTDINFLGGQVGWMPVEETVNGVLVIDGSIWPPDSLGLLHAPVRIEVKKGKISHVDGGNEAITFSRWLASFGDEAMNNVAHICYGFNPGARLTGNILEDERAYGASVWGFGNQPAIVKGRAGPAKAHTDGVVSNPTVAIDGKIIEKDGQYLL